MHCSSVFFAADVFFRYAMPCSTLFVLAALSHKDDAVNLFIDIALAIIAVIGFVVQWAYLASVVDMSLFYSFMVCSEFSFEFSTQTFLQQCRLAIRTADC